MAILNGATLIFDSVKYLREELSYKKLNVYTVSSPFNGTLFASPKIIYSKIRDIFPKGIADVVVRFYESISSNSHMDYDIGVLDQVYDNMKPYYDRNFILNMLSDENINAIKKVNSYTNIVTRIDNDTMKYVIAECNILALGMCIINKLVFKGEEADGFVPLSSQLALQRKREGEFKHVILPGSQHHFLSSKRLVGKVFEQVRDNL